VQGTGKAAGTRADNQNVCVEPFTFNGHNCPS
jgi:hypothetical protein